MSWHEDSSNIKLLKRQLSDGQIGRREFLRLSTLLGMSATAAYAFAGLRAPSPAKAADLPKGGTLRVAMGIREVEDPHVFSWVQPSNIARQVVEYLTYTDYDNITRPYLAQDWQVSDDLKTWTFRLREDVKWHNGRQFTAEDAAWNIKRALDPKTGSSMVGLVKAYLLEEENGTTRLWDASAIEVVDAHTLRLNLKEPQIAVPEHLYHYPMHIIDPEEGGKFGVGSNGTGAFELVEHKVGEKSVLRRRESYWGEGPYLDQIVFIDVGEDPSAYIGAMASKQVHGIYEGDISQLDAYQKMPHLQIYKAVTAQTAVARFQIDKAPFDDPRVRKAMRLAVNTDLLLELAHRNVGSPGEHHHVSPTHPEYADVGRMKRDVEAARALLAEAGHSDGIDVQIAVKTDPAWELSAVQAMAEQMKEAGIRVEIDVMPTPQYWDIWTTVPFGFTSWGHRPLGIMVLGLAYRSGVPWNESHYSNPRFDELLGRAEGTLDVDERRTIMAELEKILQEDGPMVQPLWRATYVAYDKRVKGLRLHPSLYLHGNHLALES